MARREKKTFSSLLGRIITTNMITFINFATGEPYETFRKYNSWTAKQFGKVDRVIEYTMDDIPKEYIDSHYR